MNLPAEQEVHTLARSAEKVPGLQIEQDEEEAEFEMVPPTH